MGISHWPHQMEESVRRIVMMSFPSRSLHFVTRDNREIDILTGISHHVEGRLKGYLSRSRLNSQ